MTEDNISIPKSAGRHISDRLVEETLEGVLKVSGSSLRHYTLGRQHLLDTMRELLIRAVMAVDTARQFELALNRDLSKPIPPEPTSKDAVGLSDTKFVVIDRHGGRHLFDSDLGFRWEWAIKPGTVDAEDRNFLRVLHCNDDGELVTDSFPFPASVGLERDKCSWTSIREGAWKTGCGEEWRENGGMRPEDYGVAFCPFCGLLISRGE